MKIKNILIILFIISFPGKGQTLIFQDDFESIPAGNIGTWNLGVFGNYNPNLYPYNLFAVQSGCPTNLISGTKSMQVTGIISGGATCGYQNNPQGFRPLIFHEINATGYENITLSYKWKCYGESGWPFDYDYGELYYSLNGSTFTRLDVLLNGNTNTVTVTNLPLPPELSDRTFYIGWAFQADNSTQNQPGLTIDDIKIYGTDKINCEPTTDSSSEIYFKKISFLGTLNDVTNTSTFSNSPRGYQDFTGLTNKAEQAQGEGINLEFESNDARGRVKAWVDWDRNNVFDNSELVYDTGSTVTSSTIFGFVVPESVTPNLDYKIRIRIQNTFDWFWGDELFGTDYTACENFRDDILIDGIWRDVYGETEDYLFRVIPKCDAKILSVTDGEICTNLSGSVLLQATGSPGVTGYNWYANEFGGSPINPTPTGPTWSTPPISTTQTYWVAAYNGSCWSTHRKPVVAKISPVPNIQFVQQDPEICGEDEANVNIEAYGDTVLDYLINEDFSGSGLGKFSNIIGDGSHSNTAGDWQPESSTFVPANPPYMVFRPAMASGYEGDKFAFCISDIGEYIPTDRYLELTNKVNSTNYLNLTLKFDLFFYPYLDGPIVEYPDAKDYVDVEISEDNGANWVVLETYQYEMEGIPNRLITKTINLNSYINKPNLKIRFRMYSWAISAGLTRGWLGTAAILDNIQLFGDKPLDTPFTWTLAGGNVDLYKDDCSTEYDGTPTTEICVKADELQLENEPIFKIDASATLSNHCTALGTITVANKTKVWNPASGTDWDTGGDWKPVPLSPAPNEPPTADNCVIVKKTVNLNTNTHGLGKNLIVKKGGTYNDDGKIFIKGGASLTITDFIKSDGTEDDFVVETDGNLLQIEDDAIHTALITAEREVIGINNVLGTEMDYIYWGSPVDVQELHSFSPGTPTGPQYWAFLQYNEGTDYFDNTTDPNFIPGKGYAIRAEDGKPNPYTETYKFSGILNNGSVPRTVAKARQGYNLLSNPYPSNIDAQKLFEGNLNLYRTVFFWTNDPDYDQYQQGSDYSGNNYAIWNGTGGTPSSYPVGYGQPAPNGIIKVGQGFIVQAENAGTVTFKNNMRVTTAGHFYSKDPVDRYWLTLTSPGEMVNTALVGYVPGATNGYEQDFDAEFWGSSDAIYSIIPEKQLVIQGRQYPFEISDQIPLGYKAFNSGTHIISVIEKEGIFAESQNIYLIDKLLNKTVKISDKPYKFLTRAGEFNDRFVIVYRPGNIIGTAAEISNQILFAKVDNQIVITSTIDKIAEVELFNLNSRSVYKKSDVNSNELRIDVLNFNHQIVVVTVKTETGEFVTRKFVNN